MAVERESGLQALQSGDTDAAIQKLESACALDPADYQAHIYLGAAYSQAKRTMDAINVVTRAVQLQPSNPQARYNLGIAMERGGYPDQAITAYEQALSLQPDYPKAQEGVARVREGAPQATSAGFGGPSLSPSQNAPQYGNAFRGPEFIGPAPATQPVVQSNTASTPTQNTPYAPLVQAATPGSTQASMSESAGLSGYSSAPARSSQPAAQPGSIYGPPPGPALAPGPSHAAPVAHSNDGTTALGVLLGIVLGGIGGVVGLVLWVALTLITHVRIGYAAIGVGLLIGWLVRLGFRQGGPSAGVAAAVISLISLGLGCWITGSTGASSIFSILFVAIGVSSAYRIAAR